MSKEDLNIVLEFSGGAETLFANKKSQPISLDGTKHWTIKSLLPWMRENILTGRAELFIQDDSVRPGILVLINEVDWELLGQLDYELQKDDRVLFISTLHGG